MEQELLTLQEHLCSLHVFGRDSFWFLCNVLQIIFCAFILFRLAMYCLSFNSRLLGTPLAYLKLFLDEWDFITGTSNQAGYATHCRLSSFLFKVLYRTSYSLICCPTLLYLNLLKVQISTVGQHYDHHQQQKPFLRERLNSKPQKLQRQKLMDI